MPAHLSFNSKRYITLFCVHLKSHYEVLGVTSKATQADIKAAYYKLSMLYHPDRNQGCKEATAKFQDVKAAYDILGDYKSRRLYDKGLLVETYESDSMEESIMNASSRVVQKQRPVNTGRTPIYNFDEWSRFHYGESFQRRSTAKAEYESQRKIKEELENNAKKTTVAATFAILFGLYILVATTFEDHDKPSLKTNKK